ncbi:phenylpropionate dioxygenase [Aspergillus campestris IBT 28561]|uniref:Phenylpropionate dioxygenase n=1 Tax=Aspergillus campestris (strain IBT 28561) TaxID=1392248 RepID=A0A2I1CW16_ASPC2|nr:phenylpropionate dioxygenase [Aspergillus campestris IBT 28561]PKY01819.1 phenylpropionate dioxygenase [Aspergillus campestris IBT 28561]
MSLSSFTNALGSSDGSPERVLPASWYTSQEVYEFERRAIFSRNWLLTTHKRRLATTGDFVRDEIAGFPFILVRDKDGGINAFHNVCRHRAFPVVTQESGTTRIFSCQYHGWSYGLNGKLAKAPGYQDLAGFDKSQNGLFPIHVHIDDGGFVWINLDAGESPEIAWENRFTGPNQQQRSENDPFDEYEFDHIWEREAAYNWKLLADNGGIIHANLPSEKVTSTDWFPNASLTVSPHWFCIQRCVPTSATRCVVRHEVYRNPNASDEDFDQTHTSYQRIMSEAQDRCVNTLEELANRDVGNGDRDPLVEPCSPDFQTLCRELVVAHHRLEEAAQKEIWPARQRLPATASTSHDDLHFCSRLTASNEGCGSPGLAGGGCSGMCTSAATKALAY